MCTQNEINELTDLLLRNRVSDLLERTILMSWKRIGKLVAFSFRQSWSRAIGFAYMIRVPDFPINASFSASAGNPALQSLQCFFVAVRCDVGPSQSLHSLSLSPSTNFSG